MSERFVKDLSDANSEISNLRMRLSDSEKASSEIFKRYAVLEKRMNVLWKIIEANTDFKRDTYKWEAEGIL